MAAIPALIAMKMLVSGTLEPLFVVVVLTVTLAEDVFPTILAAFAL